MDDAMTEVLRVVIEAQDLASGTLREFTNHVDGIGGHVAAAAQAARLGLGAIGAAAAGVLVYSAKAAIDFQSMTQKIANNTTMTTAQLAQMRQSILQLSASSGAPLDQLAEGFMHVQNLGFSAADSTTILKTAMESALSTGSNVADVANTLALQMHDFGLGASDAAHAMDVLHLAAASGNATLEQFVESTSKAVTTAANLGVPLTQVDAALAALSRHMPLAQASTALAGFMDKIIAPSAGAEKELARLTRLTGVDLVSDFTAAGLKAKGLTGILADLQAATGGNTTEIMKLIPATRGGLAAIVALGTGASDYASILKELNLAYAGQLTPTAKAFAAEQATTQAQMQRLTASIQVMAIEIGSVLIPVLNSLLARILPVVQALTTWIGKHPQLTAGILAVTAAVGLLAGGSAFLGLVLGPLAGVIGAIGAPLLAIAAAAAALYLAWQTDFGGIREKTAALWAYLQPALAAIGHSIDLVRDAFARGGIGAAARVAWDQVQQLTGEFVTWLGGVAPKIMAQLGKWATEFAAWVGPATKEFLKEWPSILSTVLDRITAAAQPILGKLGDWALKFLAWIIPLLPKLALTLLKIQVAILAFIGETLAVIIVRLADWAAAFVDWIVTKAIPKLAPAFNKFLDNLVSLIRGGVNQVLPQMENFGVQIVQGLINGIGSMGGALSSFVSGFVKSHIPGPIAAILKIFSPSQVMHDLGVNVVQGLVNGVAATAPLLYTQMQKVAGLLSLGTTGLGGGLNITPLVNTVGAGGSPPGTTLGAAAGRVGGPLIGQQTIQISVNVGEGVSVVGGTASQQAGARAIGEALRDLLAASRATTSVAGSFLPGAL